jgi:alkanesulfonate monooxygenase SsuD/methylene tetrahydromethanopterin reductase-like flavin-dependent oxidoreductase (luciferase family)
VVTVALRYDLRAPDWAATGHQALYRHCMEQAGWGEQHGIDLVTFSEHHGVADGYLPAPLTMAAAVLGRSPSVAVLVAACLVPLHDPIRLAEQVAALDLLSGGRVGVVAGAGYVDDEFRMAGVPRADRFALLEEAVTTMLAAWTGEPFQYRDRQVQVTPQPASRPHPRLYVGGSSEVAARRAARLRLGFYSAVGDTRLRDVYDEACGAAGFRGVSITPTWPGFVHVASDPDRAWAAIAEYAWYDASSYRTWQERGARSSVKSDAKDIEQLRSEGIYRVLTPDECVTLAEEQGPEGKITLHPLLAGMPADLGWESLELFAAKVLPRIREGSPAHSVRPDAWAGIPTRPAGSKTAGEATSPAGGAF